MNLSDEQRKTLALAIGLALLTLAVYARVATFDFINFDDPMYVSANSLVQEGLTWDGIIWALQFQVANWHPLTWFSHMLDCELFGVRPGWHHLVNVLFHCLNSSLLFVLLQRLTQATWRSLIVAALFALHPAHVESVAWISERKDVLSTFFGILSMISYVNWVQRKTTRLPVAGLVLFALSLLAKPMLVTMPFLLLLIDLWPMQRLENRGWRTVLEKSFWKLVVEKAPWFALTIGMSIIAFIAQKEGGAVMKTEALSIFVRAANAVTAYAAYLGKLFWPTKLALYYPLPRVRLIDVTLISAAVFLTLWFLAIRWAKSRPSFSLGWFWYFGTLVPVIGLVQVGGQAMADRYTYIPSIGVFIAVIWLAHEILVRFKAQGTVVFSVSASVVLACAWLTSVQLGHWQNSATIFSHTLRVTENNPVAANLLAAAYTEMGRNEDALKLNLVSVELAPGEPLFLANTGELLLKMDRREEGLKFLNQAAAFGTNDAKIQNRFGQAVAEHGETNAALQAFHRAIQLDPKSASGYCNLGGMLISLGQVDAAITNIQQALKLDHRYMEAYNNLGAAYTKQQKHEEAVKQYRHALKLNPTNAVTLFNLGSALDKLGKTQEAMIRLDAALQSDPKHTEARFTLARRLFTQGELKSAHAHLMEVLRIRPDHANARLFLGLTQFESGDEETAIQNLKEAVNVQPRSVEAHNALAWSLATAKKPELRDGQTAVLLAEKAAALTQWNRPAVLHTLAASYAAAGRFSDAARVAEQALALANAGQQKQLARQLELALESYRAGKALDRP